MKIKFYSMIIGTMIVSLVISKLLISQVFLANSPKIRSVSSIIAQINFHPIALLRNFVNDNFRQNETLNQQTTALLENSLKSVAHGVKASTVENNSLTVYNNEVTWVTINYTLKNGKTIVIDYPLGTDPPNMEMFEDK